MASMFDHHGDPLLTGRAPVNGTSLHYRTGGAGPAVVLLHGVPKTGYHWRHLVPHLTPHCTVVVADLRGLGDSARPADGYDSATMADDIAALMSHLGHATYAVIGEEWGATTGYQLAARHRDAVTSLVYIEALMPGLGFETAMSPETAGGLYLWHLGFYFQPDVPELLISGHERALITYLIKNERLHPDTATADAIDEYVRCYSMPGGIRAMLAIYRNLFVDAEQNLRTQQTPLTIPVLAIGGAAHIAERNEAVMRLVARDVSAHLLDCGHDVAEEVPADLAQLVIPFLTRV